MTKSITIQEGGTPKPMSDVAKIRTSLQGGGTCLWVPEDEVKLTTKHITENGTYKAEDDDKYGYSQVTVNVPGGAGGDPGGIGSSLVGTDPITGNETLIGVDENGELTSTDMPSSIDIETPPTKVAYVDGDTIDLTGMVVKAYKKDGTLWTSTEYPDGYIPLSELGYSPTTIDADASEKRATSDVYPEVGPQPFMEASVGATYSNHSDATLVSAQATVYVFLYAYKNPDTGVISYAQWPSMFSTEPFKVSINDGTAYDSRSRTENGQTYYHYEGTGAIDHTWVPTSVNYPIIYLVGTLSYFHYEYNVLFGQRTETQTVTVKWERPKDSKELTDTFSVDVTTSGNNSSGGEGGGGGGGAF